MQVRTIPFTTLLFTAVLLLSHTTWCDSLLHHESSPIGENRNVANLQKLGFPNVNDETVMVREDGTSPSKESRPQKVAARYRILLLVGDNLNDFTDDFAGNQSQSAQPKLIASGRNSEHAISWFLIRCMEIGRTVFTKTNLV